MTIETTEQYDFNYYQNANADAVAVKAGFLVRQYEYGVIFDDLLKNPGQRSVQHYLVLGRRGSGKSTLLRRLQVEIDTNEDLAKDYIGINLAEEQANIYRLFDLLEEVVRELESRGEKVEWPDEEDAETYTKKLFAEVHSILGKKGKQLVLLLDNIDRIFGSIGDETALLREHLQNFSDIKIIGGSTKMTEHFWAYDQPFFEFFRVLRLKPLDNAEVKALLLNWSDKLQIPQLKEFVENRPGQLETIRILTDGLPRTLQFFVNILLTHDQESGYGYLKLLMDKLTPLYQERLISLPPSQRKIVLQMAFAWEAVGAKELALATRMETRLISAQLAQLIDKGVAEKIETRKKNHLYRLSERFFNLWLIFTQGSPKEKRRARYLSIFLENFYDERELAEMAKKHLINVVNQNITFNKAVLITKALSQTKYLSTGMRDYLIDATARLKDASEELKKELPVKIVEIFKSIRSLVEKEEWNEAIRLVQSIEQENGIKDTLLFIIHWAKGDFGKSEKYIESAMAKRFTWIYTPAAEFYESTNRPEQAEKYYRMALASAIGSPRNLVTFFYKQGEMQKALSAFDEYVQLPQLHDYVQYLRPVLDAWQGDFQTLEEDLLKVVASDPDQLEFVLKHLLIHHQIDLVYNLFHSEEQGEQLRDKYRPLYFATRLLMPDANDYTSKIPPEIRETVNLLLAEIFKKRDFYYNRPQPGEA